MKYNIIEENEHPVKKKVKRWVHIIYEIFIVDEKQGKIRRMIHSKERGN